MGHTEHTPGNLNFQKTVGGIINDYELWVGLTFIGTIRKQDNVITEQTGLANATRIVTCWNEYDDLRNKLAEVALKATSYEIISEKLQAENEALKADVVRLKKLLDDFGDSQKYKTPLFEYKKTSIK